MSEGFDASWLALRAGFDATARSRDLARALGDALPPRARLLDLGAGTFSLMRWLAPILARPQDWTMADADADLLRAGFATSAAWAEARGWAVRERDSAVLEIGAPFGALRLRAIRVDLADAAALPLGIADAVVCSALLDLVSRPWLEALAAMLEVPCLACLSVDGRDALLPAHPADRIVRHGFARDQRRDKGFGRALGPAAPGVLGAVLTARGFAVRAAATPWRIPPAAPAMLAALVAGHAEAAMRALPARGAAIAGWRRDRLAAIARARFAMRVGHCDILALPA